MCVCVPGARLPGGRGESVSGRSRCLVGPRWVRGTLHLVCKRGACFRAVGTHISRPGVTLADADVCDSVWTSEGKRNLLLDPKNVSVWQPQPCIESIRTSNVSIEKKFS